MINGLLDFGQLPADVAHHRLGALAGSGVERNQVQALVLFGSRASGTARPDSDLDLLVVERTPHLEGQAKVASWWRHFGPLKPLRLPVDLIVCGSADAARLAGSRWHVISEAARHGRVLVVQP